MAETWSRPPMPLCGQNLPSSTTLLLRRLRASDLDLEEKARPVLALAGERIGVGPGAAADAVYVLVDVGAASDDEPLAAALVTCPSGPYDVVLAALAVVASWRGRGLGGRLLAEVVDELRAGSTRTVWAKVPTGLPVGGDGDPAGDVACRRLLRRRGFRLSERAPDWSHSGTGHWLALDL